MVIEGISSENIPLASITPKANDNTTVLSNISRLKNKAKITPVIVIIKIKINPINSQNIKSPIVLY